MVVMLSCPSCWLMLSEDASVCYGCGSSLVFSNTMPYQHEPELDARAPNKSLPASPKADPLIGCVLDSKYEIVELIGEGGIGAVYRARRLIIGDEVAVKVMRAGYEADAFLIERFRWEPRVTAKIAHPNVVTIYDYGEGDGEETPEYIVMELLEGATLRALLQNEGRLAWERAVALMCDVCDVVSAAHVSGVLHRDLKPDNIIVLPPGRGWSRETVKVIDFGIAKLNSLETDFSLTFGGQLVGAPFYMAPEQWRSELPDRRTDVYALGMTLYEMVVGERPFTGGTLAEVRELHLHAAVPTMPENLAIPQALESVIRRALAKEPEARQQDADALARELREALSLIAAQASDAACARPRRPVLKFPTVFVAALLSFMVLVSVSLFFLLSMARPRKQLAPRHIPESRQEAPMPSPERTSILASTDGAASAHVSTVAQVSTPLGVLNAPRKLYEIALSHGGRRVAAVDGKGLICLWELDGQGRTREHATFEMRRARSIALSPDGTTLAAGSDDGTILLLSLNDGRRMRFAAHAGFVFKLSFSPDGETLVSAGGDKVVRRWRSRDGQPLDAFALPNRNESIINIDQSHQTLALLNQRGEIHLWSLESRRLVRSLDGHRDKITCGVFSPSGEVLALGSRRGTVSLWDAGAGSLSGTLKGEGYASSVSFSPNGRMVATGWSDGKLRLFRAVDGALLEVLDAGGAKVSCLAFSAEGGVFASGSGGQDIRLWRVEERQR